MNKIFIVLCFILTLFIYRGYAENDYTEELVGKQVIVVLDNGKEIGGDLIVIKRAEEYSFNEKSTKTDIKPHYKNVVEEANKERKYTSQIVVIKTIFNKDIPNNIIYTNKTNCLYKGEMIWQRILKN